MLEVPGGADAGQTGADQEDVEMLGSKIVPDVCFAQKGSQRVFSLKRI